MRAIHTVRYGVSGLQRLLCGETRVHEVTRRGRDLRTAGRSRGGVYIAYARCRGDWRDMRGITPLVGGDLWARQTLTRAERGADTRMRPRKFKSRDGWQDRQTATAWCCCSSSSTMSLSRRQVAPGGPTYRFSYSKGLRCCLRCTH